MLIVDNPFEIYIGIVALVCTAAGLWITTQVGRWKTVRSEDNIEDLGLTTREQEVLHLLVQGLSNAEIAEKLFLSLSTVKTHVSNLFVKMGVKNRTQALEKASHFSRKA